MKTLAEHFADIQAEYADLAAHPLSARQAMLVAVLIDKYMDRVFYAHRAAKPETVFFAEDVLAYRGALRAAHPDLGPIFDLCAIPQRAHLVIKAVKVPFSAYGTLRTEDFMVSIYNDNTVQRVVLMEADGSERLAAGLLGEATMLLSRWPILAANCAV